MDIKPTLRVVNRATIPSQAGVTGGQTVQALVGHGESPTDRIRVAYASYEPGTVEPLHWHPIEAFYFVTAGRAVVRNIQGEEYVVGPGSFIYAPPGIAGAHEWEVEEGLELISFRASRESVKKLQFTVDKETKRSYIDLDELARRGGVSFKSHY